MKTLQSGHRHNIFCVGFAANEQNVILSCAADGTLRVHDTEYPAKSRILHSSDRMMYVIIVQYYYLF